MKFRKLGWVGIVIALLLGVCSFAFQKLRQSQASQALQTLRSVRPETQGKDLLSDLTRKFGNRVLSKGDCTQDCGFGFSFNNSPLSLLRLAPPAELAARVQVESGRISLIIVTYHSGDNSVWLQEDVAVSPSAKSYYLKKQLDEKTGKPIKATAEVSPHAPASVLDSVFDLRTQCLVQIGT